MVTNLKENAVIHTEAGMLACINLVLLLIEKLKFDNRNNFYVSLAKLDEGPEDTNLNRQLNEEIKKAKFIVDSGNFDLDRLNKITEAEKTSFLSGSIRFLFVDDNGQLDWDDFDKKFKFVTDNFGKHSVNEDAAVEFLKHFDDFIHWKSLFQTRGIEQRDYGWKRNILIKDYDKQIHNWLLVEKEYKNAGFYKNPIYKQFVNSDIPSDLINPERNEWKMYNYRFHPDKCVIRKRHTERGVVLTEERIRNSEAFENFLQQNNIERNHIGYSNNIIYNKHFNIDIPFKYKNHEFYWNKYNKICRGTSNSKKFKTDDDSGFEFDKDMDLINKLNELID